MLSVCTGGQWLKVETAYFAVLYSAPSSSCNLYVRGSRCINISLLLSGGGGGGGGGGYVCVEGVGDWGTKNEKSSSQTGDRNVYIHHGASITKVGEGNATFTGQTISAQPAPFPAVSADGRYPATPVIAPDDRRPGARLEPQGFHNIFIVSCASSPLDPQGLHSIFIVSCASSPLDPQGFHNIFIVSCASSPLDRQGFHNIFIVSCASSRLDPQGLHIFFVSCASSPLDPQGLHILTVSCASSPLDPQGLHILTVSYTSSLSLAGAATIRFLSRQKFCRDRSFVVTEVLS